MKLSFFKNWIVRNILLAVVAAVVLVIGADMMLKTITRHNREIQVPDFTGMSVEEAGIIAGAHDVQIEIADSVYMRRMARGVVFRQQPVSGSHVKKGRKISLTINSVMPKKIMMPNLIGYSMRQAKAELLSRGLTLGKLVYTDDIATNNVLRQFRGGAEIKPGTPVESGSRIDLEVGLGKTDNKTFIPALYGVKYISAMEVLHNSSLNTGRIIFDRTVKDYDDSLNAFVFRQEPDTSSVSHLLGTEVDLYLTLDKNKIPVKSENIAEEIR